MSFPAPAFGQVMPSYMQWVSLWTVKKMSSLKVTLRFLNVAGKVYRYKRGLCWQKMQYVRQKSSPIYEADNSYMALSSGIPSSEIQTSLLSYRDNLENWNFTSAKFTYEIFQKTNDKGADQTARMRRLVCACVCLIWFFTSHQQSFI